MKTLASFGTNGKVYLRIEKHSKKTNSKHRDLMRICCFGFLIKTIYVPQFFLSKLQKHRKVANKIDQTGFQVVEIEKYMYCRVILYSLW
jgi:hypothetical protein